MILHKESPWNSSGSSLGQYQFSGRGSGSSSGYSSEGMVDGDDDAELDEVK